MKERGRQEIYFYLCWITKLSLCVGYVDKYVEPCVISDTERETGTPDVILVPTVPGSTRLWFVLMV